ncbi:hypothetical protein BDV24DRAFT_144280 [Aspergillus arachidicola]|uniref:Uncharacterized protein n=1 Tax=Aspergillus arachidicola TaxID=656916 RepID=A0A5N6XQN6_9EURO|nr:hypothetical protein BDV24DRAFT_144280 [Aspergillus arachidicola]
MLHLVVLGVTWCYRLYYFDIRFGAVQMKWTLVEFNLGLLFHDIRYSYYYQGFFLSLFSVFSVVAV